MVNKRIRKIPQLVLDLSNHYHTYFRNRHICKWSEYGMLFIAWSVFLACKFDICTSCNIKYMYTY